MVLLSSATCNAASATPAQAHTAPKEVAKRIVEANSQQLINSDVKPARRNHGVALSPI
jgi:hypothetical protein